MTRTIYIHNKNAHVANIQYYYFISRSRTHTFKIKLLHVGFSRHLGTKKGVD